MHGVISRGISAVKSETPADEGVIVDGGYASGPVNRWSRLMASAHGGQAGGGVWSHRGFGARSASGGDEFGRFG
jgi:hypothetical protein